MSAVHPDDRERIFAVQQTSTDSIEPLDMLWRIADRNGNYRWFHTHSEPFIAWCQS
ncbi:PAS domain-containing protein [Edaphobacter aggregans]|uniref:PAS domain-containing protein n=1 Tax=Edaphobacter aggregans TaxID=570835 RepID=UPI000A00D3B5